MPSKGIETYSFIKLPNYSVRFSVPGGNVVRTEQDNFTSTHLEVESKDISGLANFTGRFEFVVLNGESQVTTQYVDIDSFTGKLEGGTMLASEDQKTILTDDAIISYGFYGAGHGEFGLTNMNQCYVTAVSRTAHRTWMTNIVPPGGEAEQKPFSRFALASPHDGPMSGLATVFSEEVLKDKDEAIIAVLSEHIPAIGWLAEHVSHSMITKLLPNLIYGLAITQKDPISVLLETGARYFEFRPAHLLPIFENEHKKSRPYFQHACIPGVAFEDFLTDIAVFLDNNPAEHVVVHIRWDNIVADCRKPTTEELDHAFDVAISSATKSGLKWGKHECFKESVATLRADGRRLIRIIEADKYDSWTAQAYATIRADSIIKQFEGMNTAGQEATDVTILQCQATSQSIKEVLVHSVLTANRVNSCLTSTKADLDRHTLPWLRDNAMDRLKAERLLVVMNDFLEGATTEVVMDLNKQRFALP
ncbi:PLC-like phosphodiesterase [Microthyrium microscopicum]|uniref:PLC-like phosphodiesterase n=1 Tax=Microthyrium microscopicum TaxID=703497 RepID=A0A6A6ULY0_9PEZI|nr:PLC-like phosphodiesterase [Microthyrium microscopicum]